MVSTAKVEKVPIPHLGQFGRLEGLERALRLPRMTLHNKGNIFVSST